MPTETVTVYPKCEALVPKRDAFLKRVIEHPCMRDGAKYLIFGGMGVIEQGLCPVHRKLAGKQHPDWEFRELKWAVRKEVREVREVVRRDADGGTTTDDGSGIPF